VALRTDGRGRDLVRHWSCDEGTVVSQTSQMVTAALWVMEVRFGSGERLLVTSAASERKRFEGLRRELERCRKAPKTVGASMVSLGGPILAGQGKMFARAELVQLDDITVY
jgi:hypothetical protein